MDKLDHNTIMKALDWAYNQAIDSPLGLDSAKDMSEDYLSDAGSLEDKINSLIRWQNVKAGTSGFVSGLGGMITLPVTLPANITSVLFIQIRMIAAIAIMCGYDVKHDRTKTLVYICLVGNGASQLLKQLGIEIGKQVVKQAIKNITGRVLIEINKKVGFRLLTKFGEKGLINLGKSIPFFGGFVGGAVDSVSTNLIGNLARDVFMNTPPPDKDNCDFEKKAS